MKKMTAAMAALGVVAGLGAAALPLASYAASENVPVTAIIDTTLSISTSAEEVKIANVVPGGAIATEDLTVTVSVNSDATGSANNYDLTIKDSDAITALVAADGVNNIPAGVPTANGANSAWGFATVNTGTGVAGTYKPVTTTDQPIVTDGSLANAPVSTVLRFGVNAKSGQAAGTYTGGVILTATAK